MKSLVFDPARSRVRSAHFEERSLLPAAAACVVAGGVREALGALMGSTLDVRIFEPSIPTPQAWTVILKDALLYRVAGPASDAAIVLRPGDALKLAAALFGEPQNPAPNARKLSPIEHEMLDRGVKAIAGSLSAVCGGRDKLAIEPVVAIEGLTTFFEVLIQEPVDARIGVALSRDPTPEPCPLLCVDDLAEVRLPTVVSFELGTATASAIAEMRPGEILSVDAWRLLCGALAVFGKQIARGRCGARNDRYAFVVEA